MAKKLGIPEGTMHKWFKAVRAGKLDIGEVLPHTHASTMTLSEEVLCCVSGLKDWIKKLAI